RHSARHRPPSHDSYCGVAGRFLEATRGDAGRLGWPALDDPRINGTFRGGKDLLLQRWYPFLEGYSPRLVEQILSRFAPRARRVLDPFAGVGTTPITAARLGIEAGFCEANPLLQFLTTAKLDALRIPARERRRLVAALRDGPHRPAAAPRAAPPGPR